MEGLNINKFVESVQQSFLELKAIPNDREVFLIEKYLEKAINETYAEVMLGGPIYIELLQIWKKRTLLVRDFLRILTQILKRKFQMNFLKVLRNTLCSKNGRIHKITT